MSLRLLSFAVASGKIAHVFLIGETLQDWRVSDAPMKGEDKALAWATRYITDFEPDVILTEDVRYANKKGEPAKLLIEAISSLAEERQLLNPRIRRQHEFANKYEEADAIAARYPELAPWLSRQWRRFFDNEPRNTVLFETMSYALYILRNPTPALARAMG